jgi:hypothetical protein
VVDVGGFAADINHKNSLITNSHKCFFVRSIIPWQLRVSLSDILMNDKTQSRFPFVIRGHFQEEIDDSHFTDRSERASRSKHHTLLDRQRLPGCAFRPAVG